MSENLRGLYPNFVDEKSISRLLSFTNSDSTVEDVSEVCSLLVNTQTKQAKDLIRSNHWSVNHPIRKALWEVMCNQLFGTRHEELYKELLQDLFGEHNHPSSLPSFVDPAYCIRYHLNSEGRKCVERILHVVHHIRPDITYSPILYPMISLFLHYMPEESAFSCICNLLSEKQFFVSQTKSMHMASSYVVLKLAKKFAKSAFLQLEKEVQEHENFEDMFQSWLIWIFKGLPFSYLVRIIDCFLLERKKALYRIVLAVLLLYSKHCEKSENIPEEGIMQRLLDFCQNIPVPVEKLFKVAYGIRGFSEKLVTQQLIKAEMVLKSKTCSGDRAMSLDRLPSSDSAYHLHLTSAEPTVKELKISPSARTRSLGVIPLGKFMSEILNADQMGIIWSWLPLRVTMFQPEVIYSTNRHGTCLTAFYMTVSNYEPTILVIKSTTDEIFGAYCSSSWSCRNSVDGDGKMFTYFGTGETFLFTLVPNINKYSWIGMNNAQDVPHSAKLFMAADNNMINVGAGTELPTSPEVVGVKDYVSGELIDGTREGFLVGTFQELFYWDPGSPFDWSLHSFSSIPQFKAIQWMVKVYGWMSNFWLDELSIVIHLIIYHFVPILTSSVK